MQATKAKTLDHLISQLEAQILATEHLGIPGTRLLLNMARLDLQAKRHDIDHDELKTLCSTLERALTRTDRGRRIARPVKRTRDIRLRIVSRGETAGQSRVP